MKKLIVWPILYITLFSFVMVVRAVVVVQNPISSDDLQKLRNLQYEQAKRIVRMQELKSEFDKLNSEQQQYSVFINDWIKDQAKKQNIDLAKYQFNFDQLKFVEIKKNE